MQAQLRLSVGEHSFHTPNSVDTYEGEQPRKGDRTQLGSGSAVTIETLYCPSKPPSLAHTQKPFREHWGQGLKPL